MKNSISKFMMIAAVAATLFTVPAVQAAPAPGGGSGTTTPTPVEEQAVPAKSAVAVPFHCNTGNLCSTSYVVPVGMRLVVQNVSGLLGTPSTNTTDKSIIISYTLDGASRGHVTVGDSIVYTPSISRSTIYIEKLTNFYVDSFIQISVPTLQNGGWINLEGYLVKK